jgi:hypothetical protein
VKLVQRKNNTKKSEQPTKLKKLSLDQQAKISDLLQRWNSVQGRLKRAEQISQIAVIPAINELRYAGRMLVAAMSNTTPTDRNGLPSLDEAIVVAAQYITNADHDISDALIYFYQKKADDLNARFGAETIRLEFPEYGELLELLKSARNLVISSRASMSDRQSNYATLSDLTDQITDKYFLFVDVDVLFGLEVEHYEAKIKLWKFVSFIIALLMCIISFLVFLF